MKHCKSKEISRFGKNNDYLGCCVRKSRRSFSSSFTDSNKPDNIRRCQSIAIEWQGQRDVILICPLELFGRCEIGKSSKFLLTHGADKQENAPEFPRAFYVYLILRDSRRGNLYRITRILRSRLCRVLN